MRLILVRHADAHAGLTGVIGGRTGCRGLTELGRRQAGALRDRLATIGPKEIDVLLASEIPRAVETASIIAPALDVDEVPQDCDLCEVHTGAADGLDWSDHGSIHGTFDMPAEPDRPFAPGGDSWNSFHDRVRRLMDRLAGDHAGRTVMAVSHAGVIAASMAVVVGYATPPVRLVPTNTGLTEWHHDPSGSPPWTLRYYNDASHLSTIPPAAPPEELS